MIYYYEELLTKKNISEILDKPISWHSFSTRLTNSLIYGMNARSESIIYDFTTCTLRDVLLRIVDIGEIAFINDCKRIGKKTFLEFKTYLDSIKSSNMATFYKDPTVKRRIASDRVILGLENCLEKTCWRCPYLNESKCNYVILEDALFMLKNLCGNDDLIKLIRKNRGELS